MEEQNKKENVKDRPSVIAYMGFLQNVISRMGGNSTNIKSITIVTYTLFVTILGAIGKIKEYWWIGLIVVFYGMIMDSYYLAYEKMYRKKYNKILDKLNTNKLQEEKIYDMNCKETDLKHEMSSYIIESFKSFSIIGFYALLFIITIVLKFI